MANSLGIWCIIYDDYTTEFVKAYNIWQIINTGKIDKDPDHIMSITRVEFAGGWADENDIKDVTQWD